MAINKSATGKCWIKWSCSAKHVWYKHLLTCRYTGTKWVEVTPAISRHTTLQSLAAVAVII